MSSAGESRKSVVWQTLVILGGIIATVVLIVTLFTYLSTTAAIERQARDDLEKYITERTQRERMLFRLAEDNHATLRQVVLDRLRAYGDSDPVREFDRLFVRQADGVIRNRPELFDGTRMSGVYVDGGLALNADVRRRVLAYYEVVNEAGPYWHNRFQDTYISTPENIMVIYWPEVPTWAQDAAADLNMPTEEYVYIADAAHNPMRESAWTGLFYDAVSHIWMVSVETPIDLNGRHIGTIGHDITVTELLDRTVNEHIEGGYNVLFRQDGRLIAHPQLMDQIIAAGGAYDIASSPDEDLKHIYRLVANRTAGQTVLDDEDADQLLGVGLIEEPGWYLVTVYPNEIAAQAAAAPTRRILILGLVSLLLYLGVVYFILRKKIADPLADFVAAAERISEGDYATKLNTDRQDELGRLAVSLSDMQHAIGRNVEELNGALDAARRAEEDAVAKTRQVEEQMAERERAEATIQEQARLMTEMSTPVIRMWEGVVMMPIIGSIDTARSAQMTELLLASIVNTGATAAILDVTGLPTIDTSVARHIIQTVDAARILGAHVIITGFSPEAAQTLAQLGVDFTQLKTRGSLSAGIKDALRLVGQEIRAV